MRNSRAIDRVEWAAGSGASALVAADRDQRQDEQAGGQDEVAGAAGRQQIDEILAEAGRDLFDRDIERQHLAARRFVGAMVEPALGHQEQAGDGEAAQRPQQRPHDRVDDQRLKQHRGRQQGREDRKGPDIADPAHEFPGHERTRHEAREIGSQDRADGKGAEMLERHSQAEEGLKQAGAEQQDAEPEQQRADIAQDPSQTRPLSPQTRLDHSRSGGGHHPPTVPGCGKSVAWSRTQRLASAGNRPMGSRAR
ncbi:MAG: hypothetical protein JWO51_661 [Rhodospirillales bacterium]|nr:hypothetical protein [Rhodospirillales bacterium]